MMEDLASLRGEIDAVDSELLRLFERRMDICSRVAAYKAANGLAIYSPEREAAMLDGLSQRVTPEMVPYARGLYQRILELSKEYQHSILDSGSKTSRGEKNNFGY